MSSLKRDPVHRKIMKTRDAFVAEDQFDPDEALVAAVKKRKFLLERMLEDRQHFPDEDDDDNDEDNACVPDGLRHEFALSLSLINTTYVQIKQLKQAYCLISV